MDIALRFHDLDQPFELPTGHRLDTDTPVESRAVAVHFETIDIDNAVTQRDPRVALAVIELRVICAKYFLAFRETNDVL